MKVRELMKKIHYTLDIDILRDGKLIGYYDGLNFIQPELIECEVICYGLDSDKNVAWIEVK